MNRLRFRTLIVIATVFVLSTVTTARAQGFISPLIGYNFGGDSGCQEITNCEDKRMNIGVAFGVLGPVFGFEEEIADAKNFFGDVPSQSSSVVTVMSNFMLAPALGPVHPYVLGGIGLIKTHVEFNSGSLLSTTNNDLGWDFGGGAFVFFGRHLGIRGDIRHFRTFEDLELPVVGTSLAGEALKFGRASGALVLRF
jgi:hypothetical protein